MKFLESIGSYIPAIGAIVVAAALLLGVRRLLARGEIKGADVAFRNQLLMLGLSVILLLLIITILPMGENLRGQMLGFLGILLSAAIALSSATILGNAMAGLMLRSVRNFRLGNFISVGEHFGRVSERSLFHTEIQTEDRDLTTLPNLFLVTHPVKVIRPSGTIVSATVSLGYDEPREKVESLLLTAAGQAGLTEPFVQILDLGDFSVTYRVAGLLKEVKHLLSVRSQLRGTMMDTLHGGDVQIVSPTFMNTRALRDDQPVIPEKPSERPAAGPVHGTKVFESGQPSVPEAVVFDKADQAESLQMLKNEHSELAQKLEALQGQIKDTAKDDPAREQLKGQLAELERRQERLAAIIEEREAAKEREDE